MRVFITVLMVLVFGTLAHGKSAQLEKATFAGGCFWCMEPPFDKLDGVVSTISGFSGGKEKGPSYKQVASGKTSHTEVVQVNFDPKKVTYKKLVETFWQNIDPTDAKGQFVDRGQQYRPEIFVHSPQQRKIAEASKKQLIQSKRFKKPIIVPITDFTTFFAAEKYHQNYYVENPLRYKYYRYRSGRDQFLEKHWKPNADMKQALYKKPSKKQLKAKLTKIQYYVTQEDGTERPFENEFWDNKAAGVYVDIVSGEPLFSSLHKFKSGTGWPSFYQPIEPGAVAEKEDNTLFMKRVEVRSKKADSHLGHIFKDGPKPTGLRYCINSAALRFVAAKDLEKNGLGKYKAMFDAKLVKRKVAND